ncbi:M67 family metallopeptidase [Sphingomonas sp.]|uniref:M67 family metallopeptidase n=1 Tax=Sphingomonas sp. TaxID=28214 RepID=UPI0035BC6BDD
MYVTIATAALATIRADVAAAGGLEACGLLLGAGAHVATAQPCANVAADPARRFEIDPATLLAAHRLARSGGPQVLGHYHSHPGGSPVPSPRDAADAAPDGALWLIVGAREARLWRAVADGAVEGRFDPVPCPPLSCALDAAAPEGPR